MGFDAKLAYFFEHNINRKLVSRSKSRYSIFYFFIFGLPGESFPRTQKMSHDNAFLLLLLVLRDAFFVFFGGLFSALYSGRKQCVCVGSAGGGGQYHTRERGRQKKE